jgi:hypothetical protein
VLIDADNAQPSVIEGLLAEVAKLGVASVKRIYGDWTSSNTTQWKQSLLRHSITPVQQGLVVYGFGEKKTPDAFVAACDKFIYTEVLRPASEAVAAVPEPSAPQPKTNGAPVAPVTSDPAPVATPAKPPEKQQVPLDLIRQAIEEESDDSGWAPLSAVGSYVQRIRANFDARLYGSKKLSDLLRKFPNDFDIEERGAAGSSSKTVFVRKPARKTSGPNGRATLPVAPTASAPPPAAPPQAWTSADFPPQRGNDTSSPG